MARNLKSVVRCLADQAILGQCQVCGEAIPDAVCLPCIITLDDDIHRAILTKAGRECIENESQHRYFMRLLDSYTHLVAQARGLEATP